ncbi:MAG: hypothetical protein QOC61_1647, partial [Acidobacteriota bacterium]|nr:hypothetical protein [Acidobacteriota bacterium]
MNNSGRAPVERESGRGGFLFNLKRGFPGVGDV